MTELGLRFRIWESIFSISFFGVWFMHHINGTCFAFLCVFMLCSAHNVHHSFSMELSYCIFTFIINMTRVTMKHYKKIIILIISKYFFLNNLLQILHTYFHKAIIDLNTNWNCSFNNYFLNLCHMPFYYLKYEKSTIFESKFDL